MVLEVLGFDDGILIISDLRQKMFDILVEDFLAPYLVDSVLQSSPIYCVAQSCWEDRNTCNLAILFQDILQLPNTSCTDLCDRGVLEEGRNKPCVWGKQEWIKSTEHKCKSD